MSKENPFDPGALAATEDLIANQRKTAAPRVRRNRPDGQFIRVPFEAVAAFPPPVRVLLRLLYLAWWHRSTTVVLANKALAEWGVTRGQKYRALQSLEEAGWIAVEQRPDKSPRVTLLIPPVAKPDR